MTPTPTRRAEHGDVPSPSALVVFGANGGTGRAVVRQALAAGHRVRAVTRHPDAFPRSDVLPADRGSSPTAADLEVVPGDSTDPASVADAVAGADAVLSALGTPFTRQPVRLYSTSADALITGMRRHGVRRLAVVSSANTVPDGPPQGLAFDHVVEPVLTRVLGRTLYADMRRMEEAVRASDLDWTIVRPSGLSDTEGVSSYRVSGEAMVGTRTTRQDLADFLLTLATGTPSQESGPHDGFHRQVAYVLSPGAQQSVLSTIWHDGLGR